MRKNAVNLGLLDVFVIIFFFCNDIQKFVQKTLK